jgi:hypothetical protein
MTKRTILRIIVSLASLVIVSCVYFIFTAKREVRPIGFIPAPTVSSSDKHIEDKNEFYDISAVYPVDSRDKDSAIEKFITYKVNEKKVEWKIGGTAYVAEKEIAKDFPDRPMMQYQYSITYKKYESKKFNTVSYVFTVYEYVGGANGNITVNTFTFNKDGVLAIDSVLNFNDGNDIALSRLLESALIAHGGENVAKDMIRDGLGLSYLKADGKTFDAEKCNCDGFFFGSNFQNFVVEDGGLRFIFNKYQVAPGSEGLPEVLLSWDMLASYRLASFK